MTLFLYKNNDFLQSDFINYTNLVLSFVSVSSVVFRWNEFTSIPIPPCTMVLTPIGGAVLAHYIIKYVMNNTTFVLKNKEEQKKKDKFRESYSALCTLYSSFFVASIIVAIQAFMIHTVTGCFFMVMPLFFLLNLFNLPSLFIEVFRDQLGVTYELDLDEYPGYLERGIKGRGTYYSQIKEKRILKTR